MLTPTNWTDYELIDSGDGEKLERWGEYILSRPEPQALWPKHSPEIWSKADLSFVRGKGQTGRWKKGNKTVPESWNIHFKDLVFKIKPTGFKHTGLFPEQAVNWEWIQSCIVDRATRNVQPLKILNLFGYTGGATLMAAKAGASVTHVDASEGIVAWARENAELSGLKDAPIRWITDDALAFVEREGRRGETYDAIIMDPPSYGRGANGSIWKFEEKIVPLLIACNRILTPNPLFILINSYTTGFSPTVLENLTRAHIQDGLGTITSNELTLMPKDGSALLPAGHTTRWIKQ